MAAGVTLPPHSTFSALTSSASEKLPFASTCSTCSLLWLAGQFLLICVLDVCTAYAAKVFKRYETAVPEAPIGVMRESNSAESQLGSSWRRGSRPLRQHMASISVSPNWLTGRIWQESWRSASFPRTPAALADFQACSPISLLRCSQHNQYFPGVRYQGGSKYFEELRP